MEATTPELGPVGFWSPNSSSFSISDSIVVEEAARNFRSPRSSINKSCEANSFIQHDKVEASKLCRYLETCGRALEQFLQRQMSSNDSIIFLLRMPLDRLVHPFHLALNAVFIALTWACTYASFLSSPDILDLRLQDSESKHANENQPTISDILKSW